ncbi:MAG: hypothetical protein GY719_06535 [bacterium]|nr:hypothetical protein [bacterium]
MTGIFDNFVRSLEPTGEPTDEALDDLWTELRRLLRRSLQRRGLWDLPPSYVGVKGSGAWISPQTADRRGMPSGVQDALDDLVADFYLEMFVRRLPNLRRYVERGDCIEGVVRLGATQLLDKRQRVSDRLGFNVYKRLRAALQRAVAGRRLYILGEDRKIHNGTVFGFDPAATGDPAGPDRLEAQVRRWNDELFIDWTTARGSAWASLTARLEAHILELSDAGVEVFGFKALVDAFKRDVRERVGVFQDDPSRGTVATDPLQLDEQRGWVRELSECVEAGISSGGGQRRTRNQLRKLWRFLETFALTAADPELAAAAGQALRAVLERDSLPSHRELSRLLGFRHDRFPVLFARLRDEVRRCLGEPEGSRQAAAAAAGGGSNTDTLGRSADPRGPEASLDKTRDLRDQLRRATAEAYAQGRPSEAPDGVPAAGNLIHLEACPVPGLEWLVVEVSGGECLLVPADSQAWIGSADVAANDESVSGPLSFRCDLGVWLESEDCANERRGFDVAVEDLERVRSRREQLVGADPAVPIVEQEVDADPDYLEWRRSLEGARNGIVRAYAGCLDEVLAIEKSVSGKVVPEGGAQRRYWYHRPLALAASIATVVATGAVIYQTSRISELETELEVEREPEVAVPWLLAPFGNTRGKSERLEVPAGARSIVLLLDAADGDRVEVLDDAGKQVWSSIVNALDTPDEVLVRLPAALLPPGEYEVKVWRGEDTPVEFELLIETPSEDLP